jgi:DNA-binding PadR family transcriptional regulator
MESKPIRLTGTSYAVLALIQEYGEATSYDLKQMLETSIENFWTVPHTTAYEEPARLAAAGYLSAHQEEGGRRKRVYALTDAGRDALQTWAAEPTASPPQLRDESLLKVFAGADPRPLLGDLTSWHREKLAELEGYLAGFEAMEGMERSQRTLIAGVGYHRRMLGLMEWLAELAKADTRLP